MSCNWPEFTVADLEKKKLILVQDGNHGEYRPRKNEFDADGIAFIRAADFCNGTLDFTGAENINDVAFQRIRKGIGKDLDTILSTKGTVGKIAFVPENSPKFVCSPQTTFWRSLDHTFLHPQYLYYALQSKHFVNQISSRKGETDMADYLSLTAQRSLSLLIPDISTQKKIVAQLSVIDAKLQLGAQTNQTLEAIAQAIFKSWFVDFDSVKAKMNGEQPEGMDAATASLFPEKLVESELGLIPEGWEVKPLDKVAHFQNGLALQKFRPESEDDEFLPVLKIAQLRQGYCDGKEKARTDIKESCRVYDGDMIFSWSGSLMIDLWTGGNAALNQHLFKVTSEEYNLPLYLFWTKHHLVKFQQIAKDKAVTMGHIKRGHLSESLCVIPPKELRDKMDEVLMPLINQGLNLRLQSNQLAALRDTLLPKLLSGEIDLDKVLDV